MPTGQFEKSSCRCVVTPALCALNYEVVDLPKFGMQQDYAAAGADEIYGVRASDQHRRRADNIATHRKWDQV